MCWDGDVDAAGPGCAPARWNRVLKWTAAQNPEHRSAHRARMPSAEESAP